MRLCKYKNIFGIPNTGFHSYRLFGIAIGDLVGTVGIAYLIHKYYNINFYKILVILLLLGEFMHYIFCVDTPILRLLDLTNYNNNNESI
jgi:hypothetical protein